MKNAVLQLSKLLYMYRPAHISRYVHNFIYIYIYLYIDRHISKYILVHVLASFAAKAKLNFMQIFSSF